MGNRREIKFGIYIPQLALDWPSLSQRARWCEELGFDSFWLMDHLYPPGLPQVASFEAWTTATALLASTERLRVGHMVLATTFRHPALLGKMATTLDHISGGRLMLGIGSGSGQGEHEQIGLPWGSFAERTERLGESLEILTRMFRGEPVTFEGKHYTVRDLPNLPPPVTDGGPPIVVGGKGPRTLELAARYASMWNCPTYGLAETATAMAELDAACARVGRDPSSIMRSTESVLTIAPTQEDLEAALAVARRRYPGEGWGMEHGISGTPQQAVDALGAKVEAGIEYFVFFVYDRGNYDTLALLAEEIVPKVRAAA